MTRTGDRDSMQSGGDADPFVRVGRRAGMVLGFVSGLCLFVMMLMTFVDVIGRYILAAPIRGAYELTELMLAVVVFGVLPAVTLGRNHVSTGLFDAALRGKARLAVDLFVHLAGMLACGTASYALALQARQQMSLGTATSVLGLPTAPIVVFIAAMTAISALILALLATGSLRALLARRHPAT